jgi:hypothetical protein
MQRDSFSVYIRIHLYKNIEIRQNLNKNKIEEELKIKVRKDYFYFIRNNLSLNKLTGYLNKVNKKNWHNNI